MNSFVSCLVISQVHRHRSAPRHIISGRSSSPAGQGGPNQGPHARHPSGHHPVQNSTTGPHWRCDGGLLRRRNEFVGVHDPIRRRKHRVREGGSRPKVHPAPRMPLAGKSQEITTPPRCGAGFGNVSSGESENMGNFRRCGRCSKQNLNFDRF